MAGPRTFYVVKHRTCEHIAGIGPSRDAAEKTKRLLEMTGNHGFRIQAVTGTEQELTPLMEAVARGERCATCDVAENIQMVPGGVVTGHGIHFEATSKAHADIADPGAGEHLWIVVASHRVTPVEGGRYELDHENLLSVDGPGCFKCEQPWSLSVAAATCTGSMT